MLTNFARGDIEECILKPEKGLLGGQNCLFYETVSHFVCEEEITSSSEYAKKSCYELAGTSCGVNITFHKVLNLTLELPHSPLNDLKCENITYDITVDGANSVPMNESFLVSRREVFETPSLNVDKFTIRNSKINQIQPREERSILHNARVLIIDNNTNINSLDAESVFIPLTRRLERLEILNNPIKRIDTAALIFNRYLNKLVLSNMKLEEDGIKRRAIQVNYFNCNKHDLEIILRNLSLGLKNVGENIIMIDGGQECKKIGFENVNNIALNNSVTIDLRDNKFDGILPNDTLELVIRAAAQRYLSLQILTDNLECCDERNAWLFVNRTNYKTFINANCRDLETGLKPVKALEAHLRDQLCLLKTNLNSTTPRPPESDRGFPSYLLYGLIGALILIPVLCLVWFMNCCSASSDEPLSRVELKSQPKPAKPSAIQPQTHIKGAKSINKRQSSSGLSALESQSNLKRTKDLTTIPVSASKISLAPKQSLIKSRSSDKSATPGSASSGPNGENPSTPRTTRSPISSTTLAQKSPRSVLESSKVAAKHSSPKLSKSQRAKSSPK